MMPLTEMMRMHFTWLVSIWILIRHTVPSSWYRPFFCFELFRHISDFTALTSGFTLSLITIIWFSSFSRIWNSLTSYPHLTT